MLKGKELISDIDNCHLAAGQFALWWLGQHGFVIKAGETIIYLDTFLTAMEKRLVPPLVNAEDVHHADIVFGSHDHGDHIDRDSWPKLAKASPQAIFVVPKLLLSDVANTLGIAEKRFIGANDGESFQLHGLTITGIASAHEFLDRDEEMGLYPYLGFVIEGDGFCLYHSGDSCIYEGMQAKLNRWSFDVAMLPINGRDAKRLAAGCIGCMTYQEAVDLAGAIEPGLTIPTHYDMFAGNSEDPQLFVEYTRVKYPHLKACICEHGKRLVLGGNV